MAPSIPAHPATRNMQTFSRLPLAPRNGSRYSVGTFNGVPMPLSPSDLTTYHLDYTDGRFASAVLEPETRAVSLLPVQLVGFNERRRVGLDVVVVPVFRVPCLHGEHTINPTAILFEADELPSVLRDMLWPREVPSNTGGWPDTAFPPGSGGPVAGNKTSPTSPRTSSQLDEYMATTGLSVERVAPFPAAGNIDDEPVPVDSSDYATPVVSF